MNKIEKNENEMMDDRKLLIAMSGGVDSSAAAALMVEQGYACVGATMKLYRNETVEASLTEAQGHTCCSLDDVEDARSVAFKLGMRFHVFNFSDDFNEKVIDKFVHAYETGDTPNPCIDCNRFMKFEKLYRRAAELGCSHVVTGHYARIRWDESKGRWLLLKAKNTAKDQSYVLSFMTQEQLAHTMFPLGEYEDKEQIRQIAAQRGFINARKHDSQDICFVPDGDYAKFIEHYTGKIYPDGEFVDQTGKVLGKHKGIIRYTIGQRKGLGLALPAPLYVCRKDMAANKVILTPESEIFSRRLLADELNWISIAPPAPGEEVRVTAKPRYRAKEAAATVKILENGKAEVLFDEPQRALTTGQAVVFYDGELVVGAGTIREV